MSSFSYYDPTEWMHNHKKRTFSSMVEVTNNTMNFTIYTLQFTNPSLIQSRESLSGTDGVGSHIYRRSNGGCNGTATTTTTTTTGNGGCTAPSSSNGGDDVQDHLLGGGGLNGGVGVMSCGGGDMMPPPPPTRIAADYPTTTAVTCGGGMDTPLHEHLSSTTAHLQA